MAKRKNKKSERSETERSEMEAPAVVHGSSEKGQHEFFQQQCQMVKESYNRVPNGKGSSPRNCFSKQYLENYDDIFRKEK